MVALLSSEKLNVMVLLDQEKVAEGTKADLVKSKLITEQNVVFVSEAYGAGDSREADIEDLLDPAQYETLVRESYAKELQGKKIDLNANIPRIAKRVEEAFTKISLSFHKTRPARLFLKKMATDPAKQITKETVTRFERLFKTINERFPKH